jgi:hypothetical protein
MYVDQKAILLQAFIHFPNSPIKIEGVLAVSILSTCGMPRCASVILHGPFARRQAAQPEASQTENPEQSHEHIRTLHYRIVEA